MRKSLLALALAGLYVGGANAATPTTEEMWVIIQQQQAEIQRLQSAQQATDNKVEATVDAVENGSLSNVADWVSKTSFGGYGELHYNNLEDNTATADKDALDLHRFVLFFGHQFNDDVRFFSEFEIEHSIAGEGKAGEVEVEQAFIEWDISANQTAKAGVFLVPVGILNETHEPDSFYGTERNPVEKNIIPSTWWEGGVAINGELAAGLSYDVAVHSGLKIDVADGDYKVRDGRQKVGKAKADNAAFTGRLKYTGIQGLELAATLHHQVDLAQSAHTTELDATLLETHAIYKNGPLQVRALYATWDIDSAMDALKEGADKQQGFYFEPSYMISEKLGVFARYNQWDNQAGSSNNTEYKQLDFGVNYWLTPTVVFKADYQNQNAPTGKTELDGLNLGVGWSF
jgi:hypothetical protein